MAMRKPLMGALLMMAMACVVRAQDGNWTDNSAKDFGGGIPPRRWEAVPWHK